VVAAVTVVMAVTVVVVAVNKIFFFCRRTWLLPLFFLGDLIFMLWRAESLTTAWYLNANSAHLDSWGVIQDIWGPFFLFWIFLFLLIWGLGRFFRLSQAVLTLGLLSCAVCNSLILTPALYGGFPFNPGPGQDFLVFFMRGGPRLTVGLLFFCFVGLLWHSRREFTGWARRARYALAGGLFFIFSVAALPPVSLASVFIPQQSPVEKPTTLFVGLDAIRAESYDQEPWISQVTHPYLEYAKNKLKKIHVYTPMAKTQLTYVALLSGKLPEEIGLDTLFSNGLQSLGNVLENSLPAELFEKHRLRISYLASDQEYAFFSDVKPYFSSDGTLPGVQNILGPILLRSPFFFGLLNNWLGLALFPEIIGNSAYADTYWPIFFVKKVLDKIHESAKDEESLILSHLVKVHWPGSLQWPFYLDEGKYVAGYDQLISKKNLRPLRKGEDISRSKKAYEQLKKQVLHEYLDPLFQRLENSGQNLRVFVMSDHGEEFFSEGPLPLSKTPRHGTSVLFEKNSNELYFRAPTDFFGERLAVQDLLRLVYNKEKPPQNSLIEMASDRWLQRSHSFQIFGGQCPACVVHFSGRIPVVDKDGEELVRVTRERKWIVNDQTFMIVPSDFGYFLSAPSESIPQRLKSRFDELSSHHYLPSPYALKKWKGYLYLDDSLSLRRLHAAKTLTKAEVFQYVVAAKANLYRHLDLQMYFENLKKISQMSPRYLEPILNSLVWEVCAFISDLPGGMNNKLAESERESCQDWQKKRPYLGDAYAYLASPAGEILQKRILELMATDPAAIFMEIQKFERSWLAEWPLPFMGVPLHAYSLWQLSHRGLRTQADEYAKELIRYYPLCWPLLRVLFITESGKRLFSDESFRLRVLSGTLSREEVLRLYEKMTL
jgi:hypothetical protein